MPRRHSALGPILIAVVLAGGGHAVLSGRASDDKPPPAFQTDVRPILQAKCVRCHAEKPRKADLDLSSPAGILKGGETGPVVVAGKPDESLLFEKVHGGAMPPDKKERLSADEVETVRRWIAAGAPFGTGDAGAVAAVSQHDVIPIVLRRCASC